MVRPRHNYPTPGELEVLQIIWQRGPCTVREVLTELNGKRQRAYTSVMSLMKVMTEKGLLKQKSQDRAYVYSANISEEKTQSCLVHDLLDRVFGGSAQALVVQLVQESRLNSQDLEELGKVIDEYKRKN